MLSVVVNIVADMLNVFGVLTSMCGIWRVLYTFDVLDTLGGFRLGECNECDDKRFLSR